MKRHLLRAGPPILVGLGMAGATLLARDGAIAASLVLALALVVADAWDRRLRAARSAAGAPAWILAGALVVAAWLMGDRDAALISVMAMGAWTALFPAAERRCGDRKA